MPRFKFVAMDSKGGETAGDIEAESQSQAISMIRGKGLFPTSVTALVGSGKAALAKGRSKKVGQQAKSGLGAIEIKMPKFLSGRIKPKHLTVFTRQLATLIDAGLPLLRGLRILLKQEKQPALREALTGMGESVEGGSTFSEALSVYPKIFDNLFINMVRAGEAGGVLEQVLTRLAEFMEKAERIKNKVKSAMVYPVVVLVVAVGILVFLLVNVIPKFEMIFNDLLEGSQLPGITRFVIGASNLVKKQGIYVVIILGVIYALFGMLKKTEKGKFAFDKIKLKAPLFGPLFTKTAIARFARTLGTLMTSGVPVLQALNIVRDTAGNEVIARAIKMVHDSVKEGDNMALPLEASHVFPGMVISMVDVGEETGALPDMLMRVANNYDEEVDVAVEGLTSVIEPIMIVFLALIIGTIVIAMFVPLISIITKLGG